jgi:hypothetical protein
VPQFTKPTAGVLLASLCGSCVYDLDQLRGQDAATTDAAQDLDANVAAVVSDAPLIPNLPEVFPDRPNAQLDAIRVNAVGRANLVAYWPLDEGGGPFVWDVTGNGNDGVLMFSPTWIPASFPNPLFVNTGELQFDGLEDYVELLGKTVPNIEAPKTISLWVRYDYEVDAARPQAMLVILNRTTAAGVRIELRDGLLGVNAYNYDPIVSMPAPKLGWHHIAYTFDGATHKLYVDGGTPVTSEVLPEKGPVVPPGARIRIGKSSATVDDPFRGFVDDVRIYDRALDAAEIKSLNQGAP